MNMPVLVDWLTLIIGPLAIIGLVVAVYARGRVAKVVGARTPTWARVVQGLAIAGAIFIAFIRIVWGG